MRRFLYTLGLAALLAVPATAQNEDGGGFIERQLEGLLSGAGRDVRVTGFAGALSSQASLDTLTIADDEGVWLTLSDVTLTASGADFAYELTAGASRRQRDGRALHWYGLGAGFLLLSLDEIAGLHERGVV